MHLHPAAPAAPVTSSSQSASCRPHASWGNRAQAIAQHSAGPPTLGAAAASPPLPLLPPNRPPKRAWGAAAAVRREGATGRTAACGVDEGRCGAAAIRARPAAGWGSEVSWGSDPAGKRRRRRMRSSRGRPAPARAAPRRPHCSLLRTHGLLAHQACPGRATQEGGAGAHSAGGLHSVVRGAKRGGEGANWSARVSRGRQEWSCHRQAVGIGCRSARAGAPTAQALQQRLQ